MREYNRQSPLISVVLNTLARDFVGDGKHINVYFVTLQGDVDTITSDRNTAYARWQALSNIRPLVECAVEDRLTGTLASVEPEIDAPNARLRIYDGMED